MNRKTFVYLTCLLAAVFVGLAAAQDPPATINVPVTYYDFRSNRSNPEFEQPHRSGVREGMVERTLDKDGKPRATAPARDNLNQGVRFWFRDWNNLSQYQMAGEQCPITPNRRYLEKFRPVYLYGPSNGPFDVAPPTTNQSVGDANIPNADNGWHEGSTRFEWQKNAYGTDVTEGGKTYTVADAYSNRVVQGQLEFTRITSGANRGMYEFSRTQNRGGSFFPLNGLGFGNNDWVSTGSSGQNNFSFTMEMVYPFAHEAGMRFTFSGDDDVWVFINDQLVLDLGGIHSEATAGFDCDTVSSLIRNGQNTLRVFYAERHTSESNIYIMTNIIAPPSRLDLLEVPPGGGEPVRIPNPFTKNADETKTVTIAVYDKDNMRITDVNCENVTWRIDNRVVGTGCEYVIADSVSGTINISATYTGKEGKDSPVTNAATMQIYPLEPECVFIQKDSIPKTFTGAYKGCGHPGLSDNIFFTPEVSNVTAYAILRDKYGNPVGWTGHSGDNDNSSSTYRGRGPSWTSSDATVATVSPNNTPRVTINKEVMGEGSTGDLVVTFTYTNARGQSVGPFADTVEVGSRREPSITVGPNPFVPGVTNINDEYKGTRIPDFYKDVIINSGGGNGVGVLIAVDAPTQLREVPGGKTGSAGAKAFAKVTIYDAVGNMVKIGYIYQAERRSSYGFVWDGKNSKGRNVGPGTYLVRILGTDSEGENFRVQKKIGVTTGKR